MVCLHTAVRAYVKSCFSQFERQEMQAIGIKSEAKLTTFEAICMIVGNSIGTGIIAVPYLATKNSILDVVWMVALAYIVNVILHLIISELSYNNGGVQLVKSFEGELFRGAAKKVFSWVVFVVYGLAIMIGVSGNINGGAQIFINWFGMPMWTAQLFYYSLSYKHLTLTTILRV